MRKAKRALLLAGIVCLALLPLFYLARPTPLPEIHSVAAIARASWREYLGNPVQVETRKYELTAKTVHEVDALVRKEFNLPPGEETGTIRRHWTTIYHAKGLPSGVRITISNGYIPAEQQIVTVTVDRNLTWFQSQVLQHRLPPLQPGKEAYVIGDAPSGRTWLQPLR